MSLFDFTLNMMPDNWFNDVRMAYGETLTDDMISQSVGQASDFFNIDDPILTHEGRTTGVYPNLSVTPLDDVLIFNREQLMSMGITEQQGLDLVMTHEGAHRALQGMDTGFDSHQEELCCDFMAGVRAGLNGIDVSQMEQSLIYTRESDTHPAGIDRVNSIEEGVRFAQEYYAEYNMAPTFSECLEHFKEGADLEAFASDGQITLRPEDSTSGFNAYGSTESTGSVGYVDNDIDDSNPSFKGYTQDEINNKMQKAHQEYSYNKREAERHRSLAKHGLSEADTKSHLQSARMFEERANDCRSEYQKWKYTKPSK